MSGFTQVLSTLIAVAVGALATYLAGAVTERTRWRRERSARWDDRRAQAYADYARAVKNVYVQCMRAYGLRRKETGAGTACEEALAELERLTDDRTAKWETVLLLGDRKPSKRAGPGIAVYGRWNDSPGVSAPTPSTGGRCWTMSSRTDAAFMRQPAATWASPAAKSRTEVHGNPTLTRHSSRPPQPPSGLIPRSRDSALAWP